MEMRIAVMGDIVPGGMFLHMGGPTESLCSYLKGFDFRIATLESAMGDSFEFCKLKMADPKKGNIIFSPDESISLLKKMHIDAVTIANNHACDNGREGLVHTIELLEREGIRFVGAGRNEEEARKPLVVEIKEKKLCFFAYYPSKMFAPYPPSCDVPGMNQLIEECVLNDIREYKSKCDYVFILPHWGNEHRVFPDIMEVELAGKFIAAGADGVMGSHTHTIQPSKVRNNKVVALSMGNFCFPDRFIDTPRITVYPDNALELMNTAPRTYDYPLVKKLTYKVVPSKERWSLICGIHIQDGKLKLERAYTYQDMKMNVSLVQLPMMKALRLNIITFLAFGSFYQFVWKMLKKGAACLRRLKK